MPHRFPGIRVAAAGLLAAMLVAPVARAAETGIPEVTFPAPYMESIHESLVRDYRPLLRAKCSAREMEVVEKAWRFQTYAMFAGGSKNARVRASLRTGTEASKQAISRLSAPCRKAYWQNQ